jgi:beta-glucoside PTS system EIICBA component
MDVEAIAEGIVAGVGGPANICSVGHCTTRLRLRLADKALADKDAVRALPGIMSTVERGGQFQVVIGQEVADVDRRVRALVADATDGQELPEAVEPPSLLDRTFDFITAVFHPLLYALVGSSMIKTFLTVAVQAGWMGTDSGTYAILSAAGSAAFYFLPVLVGITASAKLGANPYVGGTIAAALLVESFTGIGPPGTRTTFLGLPVTVIEYGQSVLPALMAAGLLAVLERWLRRHLPSTLHLVLVPAICLAVLVPATAIVFGPVGSTIANALSDAVGWVWELSPALAGAVMGGLWQVFVIFGVHWGFVPVIVNDLTVQGYSLLTGPLVAAVLAQGAAALAVFLRTRNPSFRALSGAASVSAFVAGVTEPAIYGVTLRLRRPFLYACIGGAVGGAIAAVGRSAADGFVFPALITLPAYLNQGSFTMQLTGTATAVVIAFGLTWVLGFTDVPVAPSTPEAREGAGGAAEVTGTAISTDLPSAPTTTSTPSASASAPVPAPAGTPAGQGALPPAVAAVAEGPLLLTSPLAGEVVPLAELPDPVFARGLLGPGVAIRPSSGLVRAPADATIRTVARAKHAIGLTTDAGAEVLIHLGIDTVHLAGRHFDVLVEPGQRVRTGQPIAHVELSALAAEGYDATTPVVVTNAAAFGEVSAVLAGMVAAGAPLLEVAPPPLETPHGRPEPPAGGLN